MQLISNISIKLHREYPREEDFRSKNEKGFNTVRDYKGNLFNNLEIIFFNIKEIEEFIISEKSLYIREKFKRAAMLQLKSLHGLRNTWETLSGASTNMKLNIHHAGKKTDLNAIKKRLCQSWYLCMANLHIFKSTISA